VALALLGLGAAAAPQFFGTGVIVHRGRTLQFPVPFPSIKLDSEEDRAVYQALGRPDYVHLFSNLGPRYGWRFIAEDGGIFIMCSTEDEKLRLTARVDLTRLSTRMDFRVYELSD
jgi:hypothetical protein